MGASRLTRCSNAGARGARAHHGCCEPLQVTSMLTANISTIRVESRRKKIIVKNCGRGNHPSRRESMQARTPVARRTRLSETLGGSDHPITQADERVEQSLEHLFEEEVNVNAFGHRAQKQTDRERYFDEVVHEEDEEDQNASEVSMEVFAHLRAQTDVTTEVAGSRAVEARTALRLTALTSAFDGTS